MLLCCTELAYNLHLGVSQGGTFTLIPDIMGSYHGQILIETETDSLINCTKCPKIHLDAHHCNWNAHPSLNLCACSNYFSLMHHWSMKAQPMAYFNVKSEVWGRINRLGVLEIIFQFHIMVYMICKVSHAYYSANRMYGHRLDCLLLRF